MLRVVPCALVSLLTLALLPGPVSATSPGAGSIVLPSDGEVTVTLRTSGPGVAICFVSTDADGDYDPGEPLYLDTDSDVCGANVGTNDLRLTGNAGHPSFSKVRTVDTDFGEPYAATCCGAAAGLGDGMSELDFYDADGNGFFNTGDTMYADANGDDRVNVGDFRWTAFGSLSAASIVSGGDADVLLGLATPGATGSDPLDASFSFWDVNGDLAFNGEDVAYLDLSQGATGATVAVNDVRLGSALGGGAGAIVTSTDADVTPSLTTVSTTGVAICFFDDDGDTGYDPGEPLYIDINADLCGANVAANDIRLTGFGPLPPFSHVRTVDADFGLAISGSGGAGTGTAGLEDGTSELEFYDANGNGFFDSQDTMYADVDGDNVVSVGDFRWTRYGPSAGGSVVVAGAADVALTLATPAGNVGSDPLDTSLLFWDLNGDTTFNGEDIPYLDLSQGGAGSRVAVNDIRLGAVGDAAPGSIVGATDGDAVGTLSRSAFGVSVCFLSTDGDAIYDAGEPLYIDVSADACGATVSVNDIRLNGHDGFVPFSKVRFTDIDHGKPLMASGGAGTTSAGIADATSELDFYDADGNGFFNPGDTMYADVNGDNIVGVGDLRWTPYGNLAAGTVVNTGDADVTLTLATVAANTGSDPLDTTLAYWDLDGDGAFNGDDTAYFDLTQGGSGALIEVNDIRLVPVPSEGSGDPGTDADGDGYVPPDDCNDADASMHPQNNEADNGKDDDCDGAVDEGLDEDGDLYTPIFGGDCNDADPLVRPGNNEADNGKDDNCIGGVDEGLDHDADGYTPIFGGDCNDADPLIHPNNNELDNGKDDDCDGGADEGLDLDGDSFTPIFGRDCNDHDAHVFPGADERDNVADDDCDGVIDDGVDRDHDGMDWPTEIRVGTNPGDADSDDDGLADGQEHFVHHTDPLDPDTDGDLFGDEVEVDSGSDPNDPASVPTPLGGAQLPVAVGPFDHNDPLV